MTDKLETSEFIYVLIDYATAFEVGNSNQVDKALEGVRAFIRQHFTPMTVEQQMFTIGDMKQAVDFGTTVQFEGITEYVSRRDEFIDSLQSKTVEENETDLSEYILMKISDEYPYMIFESKAKDGTIVAEPIKEMLCFRGSKSECEAEKQRLESVGQDNIEKEEIGKMKCLCGQKTVAQCDLGDCQFPKPKPPYTREEFLTVATAAMNGMLANSIDVNQGSQPRWQLGSVDLAKDACEYADSLLSEVNKRFEK
jgi:hypothetical protein